MPSAELQAAFSLLLCALMGYSYAELCSQTKGFEQEFEIPAD